MPAQAQNRAFQASSVINPALIPVCTCESSQGTHQPQQFDLITGEVLHGRIHYPDTGYCQINSEVWLNKANELGFNIDTLNGNIQMANWIYEQDGLKPWESSKACWGSG
jgi:hypothetical protein